MLWFLGNLVTIPVSHTDGADGMSVIEARARRGNSPPYHVHTSEDELFQLLEGEMSVLVDGDLRSLSAGDVMLAPKGVPHTYRVTSDEARWMVVTTNGDFEGFVRAVSRPAETADLPPVADPPTPEQAQALGALAASHGIQLIGPPLDERGALAA